MGFEKGEVRFRSFPEKKTGAVHDQKFSLIFNKRLGKQ